LSLQEEGIRVVGTGTFRSTEGLRPRRLQAKLCIMWITLQVIHIIHNTTTAGFYKKMRLPRRFAVETRRFRSTSNITFSVPRNSRWGISGAI